MYKIDRKNLKKEKKFMMTFFYVGLFFSLVCNGGIIANWMGIDTGSEGNQLFGFILVNILTILFMKVGLDGAKKVKKKNKRYDILERNGKLIKGLKYTLEPAGPKVNGSPIMAIVVDYELESGSKVKLRGDGRFDGKSMDVDELVDLLIDPHDPNNYFIDFEINESSGRDINNGSPISY